ncbi:MAG TPA: cytochrome c oxidase assembly protein [Stellaceae bacterium]|nr:cytochrome c oxidase assembly protein [Stellaceae bacterium]
MLQPPAASPEQATVIGTGPATPYGGIPTVPDALWSRWNPDPLLIAILVLVALAYTLGARTRDRWDVRPGAAERYRFYRGIAITGALFLSPLCTLSVSLFAARTAQEMILALAAAPLLAAGRPGAIFAFFMDGRRQPVPRPVLAASAFAVALWFWHSPSAYAATFDSTAVYWAAEISILVTATWLWCTLLDRRAATPMRPVGAVALTIVQMGLLGALITFAPHPLYLPHLQTAAAWGLTPLQDQQLGGAILGVPADIALLVACLTTLRRAIADSSHGTAPSGR